MSRRVLALLVMLSAAFVGCSTSGTRADGNGGDCQSFVWFRDHRYLGRHAMVHPRLGTSIGEGTVPPCSGWETPTSGDRILMREVEGVSPDIAVAQDGIPEVIYLREDVREPPPQLASYFTAPTCDPALAPIRLQGTWLAILGADGNTELDLVPPYDIEMLVTRSSPSGYERADLTVRVPPSLGQPLSHTDIEDSLWTGGEIDVIATCRGERFLATGVFVPAVNSAQS